MQLIELTNTGEACPSQWDGRLEDGRVVYIRYRHDHLTVEAGPHDADYVRDGQSWVLLYDLRDVPETSNRGILIDDVCRLTGLTLAHDLGPFVPQTQNR